MNRLEWSVRETNLEKETGSESGGNMYIYIYKIIEEITSRSEFLGLRID